MASQYGLELIMRTMLTLILTAALLFAGLRYYAHEDAEVLETYQSPYSLTQVKRLMKYHGTLAAKFDGRSWWFESNGKRVRLDTETAKKKMHLI